MRRRLSIWLVLASALIIVMVLGTAWSAADQGKTWPAVILAGLTTPLLALATYVVPQVVERHQERLRRPADLSDVGAHRSAAWLLRPEGGVVRFAGRQEQLRLLQQWCDDLDAGPVRLVVGPGGYGKTRLSREHAALMARKHWHWLFLGLGHEARYAQTLREQPPNRSTLVIVDYAETREPRALGEVLAAAASHTGRARVRILLLARTAGPWWSGLPRWSGSNISLIQSLTVARNVIHLPVRADERDPDTIIADAAAAFADRLKVEAPRLVPSGYPATSPLLRLHAYALVALLDEAQPSPSADVLEELLKHENSYWLRRARRNLMPLLPDTTDDHAAEAVLSQVVGIAALFGAATPIDQTPDLVRRAPALRRAGEHTVRGWATWLADLYPRPTVEAPDVHRRSVLGTLQPDLLAEHLSSHTLIVCREHISSIFAGLNVGQATQALTVLGRACSHHPDLEPLLPEVLAVDALTTAKAVIAVAHQFPGRYTQTMIDHLEAADLSADDLRELAGMVRFPSRELGPLAISVITRLLAHPLDSADRARWLHRRARWLREVPRLADALTDSREAISLRRELAAADRDRYLPDLAASVNNHAPLLTALGRRVEALAFSEEAVLLRQELAAGDRDKYRAVLAKSMGNYAWRLAKAGRRAEARTVSGLALQLYEELAAIDRDAYLFDVAAATHNHAKRLAEAGRSGEALGLSEQAFGLCQRLADDNRDAYLPLLATSMNTHALMLADVGRPDEALAFSEGALTWYRMLVDDNREAHLVDLAICLNDYALRLAEMGRRNEALTVSAEALTLHESMAVADRDAYLPDFAASLWRFAQVRHTLRSELGEAAAAAQRAVKLYDELARSEPGAFTERRNRVAQLLVAVNGS